MEGFGLLDKGYARGGIIVVCVVQGLRANHRIRHEVVDVKWPRKLKGRVDFTPITVSLHPFRPSPVHLTVPPAWLCGRRQ